MLKYDPEWMFAVLRDLIEFAHENEMPDTRDAIGKVIEVSLVEWRAKIDASVEPQGNEG